MLIGEINIIKIYGFGILLLLLLIVVCWSYFSSALNASFVSPFFQSGETTLVNNKSYLCEPGPGPDPNYALKHGGPLRGPK